VEKLSSQGAQTHSMHLQVENITAKKTVMYHTKYHSILKDVFITCFSLYNSLQLLVVRWDTSYDLELFSTQVITAHY
jgi:hypothetical protein